MEKFLKYVAKGELENAKAEIKLHLTNLNTKKIETIKQKVYDEFSGKTNQEN